MPEEIKQLLRISIIMPVWNGLPYVREAIDSVLSQDMQDWELLVGDNGSTDGTREYLDSLKDPRIQVFKHETNRGIFGNLNFLFSRATAAYAYILCADDYFYPGALDHVLQAWAEERDDVGLLRFNWMKARFSTGKSISYNIMPKRITPADSDFYFYLFGCAQGNLSNVSLRPCLVASLGGFLPKLPYAGDYEFWTRLGRYCSWSLVEKEVVYVRRHAGVASNYLNQKGELISQFTHIREQLYDQLSGKYPDWLLRTHGSWRYLAMLDNALILAIRRRNLAGFRVATRLMRSRAHLHPFCTLVMYVFSCGGRLFRHATTLRLKKKHDRNQG